MNYPASFRQGSVTLHPIRRNAAHLPAKARGRAIRSSSITPSLRDACGAATICLPSDSSCPENDPFCFPNEPSAGTKASSGNTGNPAGGGNHPEENKNM